MSTSYTYIPNDVVTAALQDFERNGIATIENFIGEDECVNLMSEMDKMVSNMDVSAELENRSIFETTKHDKRDQKFFRSSEDVSFFWENSAFDSAGKLKYPPKKCLNKVGHAIHTMNPKFHDVIFSDKTAQILKAMKWENPLVPQSMYIFKNAMIGGEVTPHMDSTFLYNEGAPSNGLTGMWLALEDATVDNSCLYYVPGSHKDHPEPPRRWKKNTDLDEPTMEFEGNDPVYPDDKWIAAPVKRGTLVLINGTVMHKSFPNTSNRSREIVTWHVIEGGRDLKWSAHNWLQYTGARSNFPPVY